MSHRTDRTLEPLFTLQVPLDASGVKRKEVVGAGGPRSAISSICFLPHQRFTQNQSEDVERSESSISDDAEEEFRCRTRTLAERKSNHDEMSETRDAAAVLSLGRTFLASSHLNGDSFLWDLSRRRIVSKFSGLRGPGLVLRRTGHDKQLLYQTRDEKGTVSIHAIETQSKKSHQQSFYPCCPIVAEFQTYSRTFCPASPCRGNANLVALPSADETLVTVRDLRVPSTSSPVVKFHGGGRSDGKRDKLVHGMLLSLAMSETSTDSLGWPVVSCGMESGSLFFHDLRKLGDPCNDQSLQKSHMLPCTGIKLGDRPVLGLDIASSSTATGGGSVVAIAGVAGDASDTCELPEGERGTIAVIKAVFPAQALDGAPVARLRARLPTCRVGADTDAAGMPGVSICRLRPDGRMFAIGGWDRRLRIFDRTRKASPLAILKAHHDSVTAVDWATDAATTGVLATGAGDGKICLWRCFPFEETKGHRDSSEPLQL